MKADQFHRNDGRGPVLNGCETLPPMDDPKPPHPKKERNKASGGSEKKRKSNERFRTLNSFVDFSMAGLSRAELAAWLILYRDTRDGTVTTSQTSIAKRSGLSARAIRTAIKRLVKLGLLVVVWQGGLNRGASRYRVVPLRKLTS